MIELKNPDMFRCVSFILALLLAHQASADVNLVVSIRPLQLIAESLLDTSGNVRVLVPESASPHHYTMTPSDRLALESADLIVYVGEELETELHAAIGGLGRDQSVLRLLGISDIQKRQLRETDGVDPHIWLHSDNGLHIAAAIRDRLILIEPALTQQTHERYEQLVLELSNARLRWQELLQELPQVPYAVYHDAIGYFESEFGRQYSVVLVDDPEVQPGIRHLMSVRRRISDLQPVCLFTDVTSRQNTIDTLFADHQVRQQELDLMGDRLTEAAGYSHLIDNLVHDFSSCLTGGRL